MNRSSFRRFEFFDVDTITEDITATLEGTPTCAVAEGGMLLFGDTSGYISISDRNFHIFEKKHRVFRGEIKGIAYIFDPTNHNRQFIVTIGDDAKPRSEENPNPTPIYFIKVFSLSDMARPINIINTSLANDAEFTSFAVLQDGSQIAVGFSSGALLLFTGQFLKENISHQMRNIPPVMLMSHHKYPISGLYFCELSTAALSTKPMERKIRLFAVLDSSDVANNPNEILPKAPSVIENTGDIGDSSDPSNAGILTFDTSLILNANSVFILANNRQSVKVLDERGAIPKCSTFMKGISELVVGRSEAVYNYSIDDIGGALAIFGEKICVSAVGRYTLVMSLEEKINPNINSSIADVKPKMRPIVNIYDLKNKIICGTAKKFQLPSNERVSFVLHDGGVVYLITSKWALIRFREKETSRKIEVLLNSKPPLYSLAIMLAAEEQVGASEIMKLYKLYGDYLYNKNEFDAAIVQYCYTIGYIPPSYVVMKYLDTYRILNLITYMEKLYEKGLATKDHVMLLLTCFCKVKDEEKLKNLLLSLYNNFPPNLHPILGSGQASVTNPNANELNNNQLNSNNATIVTSDDIIDAAQAIATLNSSGYSDYALKMAIQYQQHDSYLTIQLSKNPPLCDEALTYCTYLAFVANPEELLYLLRKNGRLLLKFKPVPFTALLTKLITGDLVSLLPYRNTTAIGTGGVTTTKESSLYIPRLSTTSKSSISTYQYLSLSVTNSTIDISKTLTNLLGSDGSSLNLTSTKFFQNNYGHPTSQYGVGILPIADILSLYADEKYNEYQLNLLEAFAESIKGKLPLSHKIAITLMELYLHKYSKHLSRVNELKDIHKTNGQNDIIASTEALLEILDEKIMSILDSANSQYDVAQALLLTHSFGFKKGERFLLEKQQSVDLLMTMLIESNDEKEVFKVLRREGNKDAELFVKVLTYFVQKTLDYNNLSVENNDQSYGDNRSYSSFRHSYTVSGTMDEIDGRRSIYESEDMMDNEDKEYEKWKFVVQVMDLIEKESILSPVQVISILAINPELPLHIVSRYISKTLR
eukprot:gene11998-16062_t